MFFWAFPAFFATFLEVYGAIILASEHFMSLDTLFASFADVVHFDAQRQEATSKNQKT
jgi:hypothetical protein